MLWYGVRRRAGFVPRRFIFIRHSIPAVNYTPCGVEISADKRISGAVPGRFFAVIFSCGSAASGNAYYNKEVCC